jgi:tape measure domain-containing protein
MAVSQELVARFKADTADFTNKVNKVKRDIDSVGASGKKMGDDIEVGASRASNSMTLMASSASMVATAISTATVAVGAFSIKVGSDMESATKRIEGMLGSAEKANFVISSLRDTGYETGMSVIALAESYGKLATFVENGSVSLQESLDLQNGLTSASMALGANSEQLSTVMYGLSQALGSGVVRAEEFNQVTEPLPGIINRMEEATGLASGELRKMINDGLITSDMFKKILIPALQSFETQAESMAGTLKVQAGILSNTFVAIGEDIYDNLESPLASATAQANRFLQSFISVKRASKEELNRRLDDINKQRSDIANSGNLGRYEGKKGQMSFELSNKQQEIMSALFPISDVVNEKKANDNADPKLQAEIKSILGGGGKTSRGGGSARASRVKTPRMSVVRQSETKQETPLFKEVIRDYQEDLGNFNLEATKEFDLIEATFGDMKDSVIAGFLTMSQSGKTSFKDMARSIVNDLQAIITKTLLMKAIAGITSAVGGYFAPAGTPTQTDSGVGFGSYGAEGFLSGARANGGAVGANKAYLVGERGPEILKMGSQSGNVISNENSFGGRTVINIDARGASAGVEQQIRRVMGEVINLKKQVPNIAISAVREQNSRSGSFLR